MSVINTMLKDISERKEDAPKDIIESVNVTPVYDVQGIVIKVFILLVAVTAVVMVYLFLPKSINDLPVVKPLTPEAVTQQSELHGKNNGHSNSQQLSAVQTQLSESVQPAVAVSAETRHETNGEALLKPSNRLAQSATSNEPIAKKQSQLATQTVSERLPAKRVEEASVIETKVTKVQSTDALYHDAQHAFEYGLVAEGQANLRRLLQLEPTHRQARSLLATSYIQQNELLKVQTLLLTGLEINPDELQWREVLSQTYMQQGQYARVLTLLAENFETQATVRFFILKGTAAQQLNQHELAIHCFRKLTELEPSEAKWQFALASSLDAKQEYIAAIDHYRAAIALGDLSPVILQHIQQRLAMLLGE